MKKLLNRAFPKQYMCTVCDRRYRWHRGVMRVTWCTPPTYVCARNFNCWKVFAAAVEFGWIDVYMDPQELISG